MSARFFRALLGLAFNLLLAAIAILAAIGAMHVADDGHCSRPTKPASAAA